MGKTGYSLIELLFVMSAAVTAGGIAIPPLLRALDDYRTAGAVRYISTRIQRTRMEAVTRSTNVAMQFVQAGTGFSYRTFVDGNGDGVRTQDIKNGIDYPLGPSERIPDNFSEVDFSLLPGLPAVEPGNATARNRPYQARKQQPPVLLANRHIIIRQRLHLRAEQDPIRDSHIRRYRADADSAGSMRATGQWAAQSMSVPDRRIFPTRHRRARDRFGARAARPPRGRDRHFGWWRADRGREPLMPGTAVDLQVETIHRRTTLRGQCPSLRGHSPPLELCVLSGGYRLRSPAVGVYR